MNAAASFRDAKSDTIKDRSELQTQTAFQIRRSEQSCTVYPNPHRLFEMFFRMNLWNAYVPDGERRFHQTLRTPHCDVPYPHTVYAVLQNEL